MDDLRERVRALAETTLAGTGIGVVDAEIAPTGRRTIVRLYIEKPGGVTVDNCVRVSRSVEDALDTADVFSGSYVLEVSSPGLDRPLRKPAEYQCFLGRRVRVVTRVPVLGSSAITGEIVEATSSMVALKLSDGELLSLPFDVIAHGHLDPELWENSVTPEDRKRGLRPGGRPSGGKGRAKKKALAGDTDDEIL